MAIFLIKFVHTLIFFLLGGCVLYLLFCGIANRYSGKTTIAFLLVLAEGVILFLNGWQCPLTTLAGRLGATEAEVAGLFLPRWLADHIFDICTPLFIASSALILVRRVWERRTWRAVPSPSGASGRGQKRGDG